MSGWKRTAACWQSPAVCADSAVPASATQAPHAPFTQVRARHSVSEPEHCVAASVRLQRRYNQVGTCYVQQAPPFRKPAGMRRYLLAKERTVEFHAVAVNAGLLPGGCMRHEGVAKRLLSPKL